MSLDPFKQNKPPSSGVKRILVIDDNRVVLTAMSIMLKSKGYEVMLADSGSETITVLREGRPDLILLDLDFAPDSSGVSGFRDGFVIIEWVRRTCNAENLPVIIVSSLDPARYKAKAQAAGILICFQKPVDKEKLLVAIQTILGNKPGPQTA